MTVRRWLAPAGVALAAALFAWLNRGERAVVSIGIATFYRAPLTLVLFLAFLAGMLSMLALSLRHDLRMREELRARGLLDGFARPQTPPPVAHAEYAPKPEPDATMAFGVDDHTARFQGDGAHPDDAPTLVHRREPDPPLN